MDMQIIAWIAAGLVFTSFFMKTIVPLRSVAIASNVVFIGYGLLGLRYGIFDKVLPILILHVSLLPLNLLRLREVKRTIREVKSVSRAHASLDFLVPYMTSERFRKGEWLFRKGDQADRLYLLRSGRVDLVELEKVVPPGAVFGEVGVFSESEVRTSSARCTEDCELFSITGDKAVELFYQDPRFGFYIVRALARYVAEGADGYMPMTSPERQQAGIPARSGRDEPAVETG